jgi:signal transduction histidine kinase
MSGVSGLLRRTPWWGLALAGMAMVIAVVIFATPHRIIAHQSGAATGGFAGAEKREADLALAEGGLDFARGILLGLRSAVPQRGRIEIDEALDEIERAREEVRSELGAGAQVRVPAESGAGISVDIAPVAPGAPALAVAERERIRDEVADDLRKLAIGGMLLIFSIPLLILALVAKFFIERSRAAEQEAASTREEAESQRLSRQLTEAKLQALQAQVEPHFLYNTLANVQALTETDPPRAGAMVGHLIDYLRNALPRMRESTSTVGQEIDLARAYLSILQMRMGDRLSFDITLPEALASTPFPPLMLPSLVENAVKHGLEPVRHGGHVHILVEEREGRLRVVVSDTGRGVAEPPGQGVGLANLRERLAALYGSEGRLTLEANHPHGAIATLEIPVLKSGTAPAWPAQPEVATTPARRALAVVGKVERGWRRGLSYAFVAVQIVLGVLAGLALAGAIAGIVSVNVGSYSMAGFSGAAVGALGIGVAFLVVMLVVALVFVLIYGLGWLLAGLAIFIPIAILVGIAPVLAPLILVGLAVWWWYRHRQASPAASAPGAAR